MNFHLNHNCNSNALGSFSVDLRFIDPMDNKFKDCNTHITILTFCSKNEYKPGFKFTTSDSHWKKTEEHSFYQSQHSIDNEDQNGIPFFHTRNE